MAGRGTRIIGITQRRAWVRSRGMNWQRISIDLTITLPIAQIVQLKHKFNSKIVPCICGIRHFSNCFSPFPNYSPNHVTWNEDSRNKTRELHLKQNIATCQFKTKWLSVYEPCLISLIFLRLYLGKTSLNSTAPLFFY